MFITTLRVRRARRDTLSKYLTAAKQAEVETADVVEVLAHGATVAIVHTTGPAALWLAPVAEQTTTAQRVEKFVAASLTLMGVGERVAAEATPTSGLRERAAATRRAARA